MLKVRQFVFSNFEENTYLVVDSETNKGALIDPGMLTPSERTVLDHFIEQNSIELTQIILTHAHLDHCFGADYVKTKYGVPVKAHSADIPLAQNLPFQAMRFGMGSWFKNGVTVDIPLRDGDIIEIGKSELSVLHVPGHSPGGIVLYDKADGIAFVGDSIFHGSIGRTDLEGGDFDTLVSAIKSKILTLPPDTILYSGHGEHTTVEKEAKSNPFLKF